MKKLKFHDPELQKCLERFEELHGSDIIEAQKFREDLDCLGQLLERVFTLNGQPETILYVWLNDDPEFKSLWAGYEERHKHKYHEFKRCVVYEDGRFDICVRAFDKEDVDQGIWCDEKREPVLNLQVQTRLKVRPYLNDMVKTYLEEAA